MRRYVVPARVVAMLSVAVAFGLMSPVLLSGQDDGEPAGQGPGRGGRGTVPAGGRSPVVTSVASFDRTQVERGRRLFLRQCASCHGLDARGGAGFTDVDLMRTRITYMDISGRELDTFLKTHPQGRAPLSLPVDHVTDIATWLRYEAADFVGGRGGPRHNVFSGDARAGEAYFNGAVGRCSTCHSVTGDLRGIGAKTNSDAPTLTAAILSGSAGGGGNRGGARGGGPPASAVSLTVTLENGQQFVGTPLTVNDWLVEIRLRDATIRSWLPNNGWPKVERVNRLQAHIDLLFEHTDDDIRNLAAYLRDK
jgi:mono/diheme cytochrome c family protein